MAEINIERKKAPIWRWLILLLLLALIAWAVYEFIYKQNSMDDVPATGMLTLTMARSLLA